MHKLLQAGAYSSPRGAANCEEAWQPLAITSNQLDPHRLSTHMERHSRWRTIRMSKWASSGRSQQRSRNQPAAASAVWHLVVAQRPPQR